MEVVAARVGREWVGIDVERVVTVIDDVRIEPVPDSDSQLAGLLAWRSGWLPILSGALAVGSGDGCGPAAAVLVLGEDGGQIGMTVDELGGVHEIDPQTIRDDVIPAGGPGGMLGIVPAGQHLLTLYDVRQLFSLTGGGPRVDTRSGRAAKLQQVVTFEIADQEFGLDVFGVHEIVRHPAVTRVPEAPAFVEGVMELRGHLVPVVDLRKRFEVEASTADAETRVVVVPFGQERLGLVVDAVSEVLRVPEEAITDPPEYVRGIAARYVRKLVRLEDRIIILLDMEEILSSEERIALEEMDWEALGEGAGGSGGSGSSSPAGNGGDDA